MPVEPPPSQWHFPDPARSGEGEVVGLGADLEPGTILAAYRAGIFPMPLRRRRLAWWSPEPRAVLPRLGWAHSVEAWSRGGGELEGGLYGIAIGGLFAGESMFHRATDASKVALVHLVELLAADDGGPEAAARAGRLLDVQWRTDHLASLGAVEVSRRRYGELLERALRLPLPSGLVARGC